MNLQIASPAYLTCFLLILIYLLPRRTHGLHFSHLGLLPVGASWRLRLRPLRKILRIAVMSLVVLALARPQMTPPPQPTAVPDAALVIALDISNSMRAQDLLPDRLTVARQLVAEVIAERPLLPIGLVLIAEQAIIHTPPTRSHDQLLAQLAQVSFAEEMGLVDGTALGGGVATAAAMLARIPAAERQILLFTDGVNTDAALDPLTVAQTAAALNIQIFTVGLGRPGVVPFPQQGVNGTYVVQWESLLDETLLQTMATATAASYVRITAADLTAADPANLPTLTLPTTTAVATTLPAAPPVDLFPWLIAAAVTLLLLELWLGQTILFTLPEDA